MRILHGRTFLTHFVRIFIRTFFLRSWTSRVVGIGIFAGNGWNWLLETKGRYRNPEIILKLLDVRIGCDPMAVTRGTARNHYEFLNGIYCEPIHSISPAIHLHVCTLPI